MRKEEEGWNSKEIQEGKVKWYEGNKKGWSGMKEGLVGKEDR